MSLTESRTIFIFNGVFTILKETQTRTDVVVRRSDKLKPKILSQLFPARWRED